VDSERIVGDSEIGAWPLTGIIGSRVMSLLAARFRSPISDRNFPLTPHIGQWRSGTREARCRH
jgi:hypothetical protein